MNLPNMPQRFIVPDLPTTDDLIPYLRQIDKNKWYTNFGPLALAFESRFLDLMRQAHGTQAPPVHAVGLASGYQALTVGLRMLGVQPEDKVLVPSVTFPACPLAVSHVGAEPVLSDVDPQSWTLTPDIARKAVTKNKIKAVMPVAVYGFPLPAEEWDCFSRETGVQVIIDAAAAIESQRYLRHGLVAHSLHALKPFGIGEGGLLVSSDPSIINNIRHHINFGLENRITYQTGENAKMSEYHAAIALAQTDRWEGIKNRRRKAFTSFSSALTPHQEQIRIHPKLKETIVSSLMIETKRPIAPALFGALSAKGIAAHRTYLPPLYDHPHFTALPALNAAGVLSEPRLLAGAEHMKNHVLGLPFHAFLSDDEIHETATILGDCLANLA